MRSMLILILATISLPGCAMFYDAPRISDDYGQAQRAVWSQQVANPTPAVADRTPEGLSGLPAEEIMKIYNQSFANKPTKEEIFNMGITTNGSNN